ncbi:hypothetical protein AB5J62_16650 [Amycolatopsis sp. cg5]|uniref:hypothetical protein n=1 Tax=Amycolatopsis sp. cg5 TaxID=3238802 RepID=UPI0035264720
MGQTRLPGTLSNRGRAMLRAVAAGRAEVTCSCEPDMRIDGLLCCDQIVAHELVRLGYVRPGRPRPGESWVAAELTEVGLALLEPMVAA